MGIKFSTGAGSRVQHSTGADPKKIARARRRHPRPRYSTGRNAGLAHFTGKETDFLRWLEEEEGLGEGGLHQANWGE